MPSNQSGKKAQNQDKSGNPRFDDSNKKRLEEQFDNDESRIPFNFADTE